MTQFAFMFSTRIKCDEWKTLFLKNVTNFTEKHLLAFNLIQKVLQSGVIFGNFLEHLI